MSLTDRPSVTPDSQRQRQDDDSTERAIVLVDRFSMAVSRQLEPVMAEMAAMREQIASLAEEKGRLSERVEDLERQLSEQPSVTVDNGSPPVSPDTVPSVTTDDSQESPDAQQQDAQGPQETHTADSQPAEERPGRFWVRWRRFWTS